jgi:hypothetical protein
MWTDHMCAGSLRMIIFRIVIWIQVSGGFYLSVALLRAVTHIVFIGYLFQVRDVGLIYVLLF